MAKKKLTKNLSNGKRRKRMSERSKDSKDRDEAYADLYKACTNFFDGAMQEVAHAGAQGALTAFMGGKGKR